MKTSTKQLTKAELEMITGGYHFPFSGGCTPILDILKPLTTYPVIQKFMF